MIIPLPLPTAASRGRAPKREEISENEPTELSQELRDAPRQPPAMFGTRFGQASGVAFGLSLLSGVLILTGHWAQWLRDEDRWAFAVVWTVVAILVSGGALGFSIMGWRERVRVYEIAQTDASAAFKNAALACRILIGMPQSLALAARGAPDYREGLARGTTRGELWRWGDPRFGWDLEVALIDGVVAEVIGPSMPR